MAIENTNAYKGVYHLWAYFAHERHSKRLEIASLVERVANNEIKEIVLHQSEHGRRHNMFFYLSQISRFRHKNNHYSPRVAITN